VCGKVLALCGRHLFWRKVRLPALHAVVRTKPQAMCKMRCNLSREQRRRPSFGEACKPQARTCFEIRSSVV
jgi:hypothetical protein